MAWMEKEEGRVELMLDFWDWRIAFCSAGDRVAVSSNGSWFAMATFLLLYNDAVDDVDDSSSSSSVLAAERVMMGASVRLGYSY